jgi:SAM-dependent methyltransferase
LNRCSAEAECDDLPEEDMERLVSNSELECRACGKTGLIDVLSLGETPLANSLLTKEEFGDDEPTYPLDLVYCPHCSLLQITESISPKKLFGDYLYFSSFSDTMLKSAEEITSRLTREHGFGADSLAVEIASNDGYLLQYYKAAGVPVLGIEPAANIAVVAEKERGIPTVVEFFGSELASRLVAEGKRADVVHANNVLAHVPDLNGFVEGIATLLKPEGVAVIEAPYALEFIDKIEFDTIYHEHLCYFSLTALDRLFANHGLTIIDVERLPIHGGSLRIFASPANGPHGTERSQVVLALLAEEKRWGVDDPAVYADFSSNVAKLKRQLNELLETLKAEGKRIAAYGASAKGSTLLNYCGIGAETLDYVVDRSTVKQGYFTPGMHLEILAPEHLLEDMPDYVLLLTWNFADEILNQQADYVRHGGRFIIPVPEPAVAGPGDEA